MKRSSVVFMLSLCGCADLTDKLCDQPGCIFTDDEWERLQGLAGLGEPAPDPANRFVGEEAAITLGQKFFFDTRFSGVATQVDILGRPTTPARAPLGEPLNIACASCHDPASGGTDRTSSPGNVSVGAGWYDVNANSVINSAYYDLKYWNGRYDSLVWQALAVLESGISMNNNRLRLAWTVAEHYRAEYEAIFTDHPLPQFGRTLAEQTARLDPTTGECRRNAGDPCPADCTEFEGACWPRWPLDGRSGDGVCNRGAGAFRDAFDCMAPEDRETITRTFVNMAKALAAYEYTLVSRNSTFDQWVAAGPNSEILSDAAKRGAKLFVSKASCVDCHNTPLLSDNQFHNVGVPQEGAGVPTEGDCPQGAGCDCVEGNGCLPWGWHHGLSLLKKNTTFRIDSAAYSDDPSDTSRSQFYEMEQLDSFKGTWRTPSLREVAKTAPYMHNGFYRSLEEVVEHYNRGGTTSGAAPEQRDVRLRPLGLTDVEIDDLVEFLKTLTGAPLPLEKVTAPALP